MAPVPAQDRRRQAQVAAGGIGQVGLQAVEERLRVLAGDFRQAAQPLPEKFITVGRLCHEGQDVLMIAGQGGRDLCSVCLLPTQFRPPDYRKAAPVRVSQLVHYPDGLGFSNARPAIEPVASEEAGLRPHMAQVEAAKQRLAGRSGTVERDDGIEAFFGPRRVVGMRGGQGSGMRSGRQRYRCRDRLCGAGCRANRRPRR